MQYCQIVKYLEKGKLEIWQCCKATIGIHLIYCLNKTIIYKHGIEIHIFR